MRAKTLRSSVLLVCLATLTPVANAQVSWHVVKKYLQPEVRVVAESGDRLALYHPLLQDTLVFAVVQHGDADVYGVLHQRRGGNPYRVWRATEDFWNNPERPKNRWGRYFRAEFLRLIRPPEPRRSAPSHIRPVRDS